MTLGRLTFPRPSLLILQNGDIRTCLVGLLQEWKEFGKPSELCRTQMPRVHRRALNDTPLAFDFGLRVNVVAVTRSAVPPSFQLTVRVSHLADQDSCKTR